MGIWNNIGILFLYGLSVFIIIKILFNGDGYKVFDEQRKEEEKYKKHHGSFLNELIAERVWDFYIKNPEFSPLIEEKPAYIDDVLYLRGKMNDSEFKYLKKNPMLIKEFGRDRDKYPTIIE